MADAPAPAKTLAESLREKIDACHVHAMHPLSRDGLLALIFWLTDECAKSKNAAKQIRALVEVKGLLQ